LKDYKKTFLVTGNAEGCIFGDITGDQAKNLMDKIFTNVPAGKPTADNVLDTEPIIAPVIKKYYADGPQSLIAFAMKCPRLKTPKRYPAVVLFRILGEGQIFRSRIMSTLRGELGLIYNGSVHMMDLKHSSYLLGILETDNSKVDKAIASLKKIIKNLRTEGISQDDLDFAKSNFKGSVLVELRTSASLCAFHFSAMLNGYETNALTEVLEKIDKVSLEEVNSLAGEILDENNITFVTIGGNAQ
jgi:zinc protease